MNNSGSFQIPQPSSNLRSPYAQKPTNPELTARTQTGSPLVAAAAALARSQCELDIRDCGRSYNHKAGDFGPLSRDFARFQVPTISF